MSIIVASGEAISRSPINTSASKQMYSFPKAERFPRIASNGYANKFYDVPEGHSKRSTTLGKGTKYDFTRNSKGMNAMFYDSKSDFDRSHPFAPSFSFGISREKYAKVYYETNKMFDKNIPGPGKYDYLKPFGSDATKFSIKSRCDAKGMGKKDTSPGPGQYPPVVKINDKGRYPVSKISNVMTLNFGADKEKRFNYNYNKNPGPNHYPIKTLMGVNFNSKFTSSPGKTMYGRYKDYDSRANYPGPGNYRAFSEFGIYESKYAHTAPNEPQGNTSQSKPAESKPAESKPSPSKPAETKPAESKPTESRPQNPSSGGQKVNTEIKLTMPTE